MPFTKTPQLLRFQRYDGPNSLARSFIDGAIERIEQGLAANKLEVRMIILKESSVKPIKGRTYAERLERLDTPLMEFEGVAYSKTRVNGFPTEILVQGKSDAVKGLPLKLKEAAKVDYMLGESFEVLR